MAEEAAQAVQGAAPTGAPGPEDQASKEAVKEGQAPDIATAMDDYEEQPVEFHDPSTENDQGPSGGGMIPASQDEQLLFNPTERPHEQVKTGSAVWQGKQPPPQDVHSWLPALQEAAQDPEASGQLKALYDLVVYHLQNG